MKRVTLIVSVMAVFAASVTSAYVVNSLGLYPENGPLRELAQDMEALQRHRPSFSVAKSIQRSIHWNEVESYRAEMLKAPFEYDPYRVSEHYYRILGPDIMLDILEEDPRCHLKSHNLGRLIYIEHDRDLASALTIAGARCSYGAFHGILAQVLDDTTGTTTDEHMSDDEFLRTATMFCDRPEVRQNAVLATCVHSIGHAFMLLVENELREGLDRCKVFPNEIRQYYCATGVFMQREKSAGREDASSKRFPCDEYEHPAACYRYKLRDVFPTDNYRDARSLCTSLENGPERNGCFHGLGFTYYLLALDNPERLMDICRSENETDRRMCVEGAAGRLEIYYDSVSVLPVCEAQSAEVRDWCERALNAGSGFGINDTSDNIRSYFQPKSGSR